MILEGEIRGGLGVASRALADQLPIFEGQYDELHGAYHGTINVKVQRPIDLRVDFKTDLFETGPGEWHRCEFIRVLFEFPLRTNTNAWIYQPYGYHWGVLGKKSIVEVLVSKRLESVAPGQPCRVHVLNKGFGSSSTSVHYLRERLTL